MTKVLFETIQIQESGDDLVDLNGYDFILDAKYFNQGLSSDSKIYLRKLVADKLSKIQQNFNGKYRFKIWDGYRSREVQNNIYQKFWKELKLKNPSWSEEKLALEVSVFVTLPNNPNRIPPHSTGGAVDLTLVDEHGNELDMGTPFDYFGPEASSLYFENNNLNNDIKNNRALLREAMVKEDFRYDEDEWWHYDYGNQIWALALNKSSAIYGEASLNRSTSILH